MYRRLTYATIFLISWQMSCVSYDSPMQGARTLQPGQVSFTGAMDLSIEHAKNFIFKTKIEDYLQAIPRIGLQSRIGYGLIKNFDLGLNLSFDSNALGAKWNVYSGE